FLYKVSRPARSKPAMASKYRRKRPMRVASPATPSPEFLSPMLWRKESPSHLQLKQWSSSRSFACRVVLADHLTARLRPGGAYASPGTCHGAPLRPTATRHTLTRGPFGAVISAM